MDIFTTYLYLWGSLIGCLIFALIYKKRKDLRTRMLSAGLSVGFVGILSEVYFFKDYWQPPLLIRFGDFGGLEDLLFGFAAGGIGVVIYDLIFHKRLRRKFHPHIWIIPVVVFSEIVALQVLVKILGMNSIYPSAVGFLAPVLLILMLRRDLKREIIFSAVLAGLTLVTIESLLLIFAPEYLDKIFLLQGRTALIFGLAPVTELIWGVCFGALIGPLYDFKQGTIPVNYRKI